MLRGFDPICQHRKLLAGILFREGERNIDVVLLSALNIFRLGLEKPLHIAVPSLVDWATHTEVQRYRSSSLNVAVWIQKGQCFQKIRKKHTGVASGYKIRQIAALFSFLRHNGRLLLKT